MGSKSEEVVVGVDLGGTKILTRLVDTADGSAVGRVKVRTPKGPEAVLDALVQTVQDLPDWERSVAVGVGAPGFVTADGVVTRCPNISGWDEPVDVAAQLSQRLGRPVAVANDVNCAAVAEHRLGAGVGVSDLLAVFVGTGVGGGIVIDNRLVVGPRGMAAELGHVTVKPGGRMCGCGERGHLEAYAGRAGIEAEVRRRAAVGPAEYLVEQAGASPIRSKHLASGLEEGDPTTVELLEEAAETLAMAIGNAASLLDLKRVVLGGGVVDKLGEPFLEQIVGSDSFGGFGSSHAELVPAQRLDDSVAVGAALLAVPG